MEWGVNKYALKHERNFGNKNRMLEWIRAVSAVSKMRESALLLWGGSYAVKMEQLQDDIPKLKSFLVREVLSEGQYILIKRAEEIMKKRPDRINSFMNWLKDNGFNTMLFFIYNELVILKNGMFSSQI